MQGIPCHSVTALGSTSSFRQFQLIDGDKAIKSISVAPVTIVPGLISTPEGREQKGINFCPTSLLECVG